jgi:hypothetical protein
MLDTAHRMPPEDPITHPAGGAPLDVERDRH